MCFSKVPVGMPRLWAVAAREEDGLINIPRPLVAFEPVIRNMPRVPIGQGMRSSRHLITTRAGEDVSSTILSFCRQYPGLVVIYSGSGTVSSVTIRHPRVSGQTITYGGGGRLVEVRGLFMSMNVGENEDTAGGISVILVRQDGRAVRGRVAGPLIAASPVQVVLYTFHSSPTRGRNLVNQVEQTSGQEDASTSSPENAA